MDDSNRQIISVSDLNKNAKRLLESEFPILFVEGEISNLARPSSGHWYFTLKDEKAQVRCAMFRNRNHLVRFQPRDGQQVVVRGRISLYEGRGEFQMIAESLEDSGDGALRRAFDKLKAGLQAEGIFDTKHKKALPVIPSHIAVITSPQGAAIHDILSVLKRRFPAVHASIIPVQVQGDESASQIVEALEFANLYDEDPFDLILLARGGGSLEDLWSFNTEPVARAISSSRLPVVSAIGHESDVSISDFVADLRAPTPSAAAELITPDGAVVEDQLKSAQRRLSFSIMQRVQENQREVTHLRHRLRHPASHLNDLNQRLDDLERRLTKGMDGAMINITSRLAAANLHSPHSAIKSHQLKLESMADKLSAAELKLRNSYQTKLATSSGKLDALSPLATLKRGFAIVSDAESGKILTSSKDATAGEKVRARLSSGSIVAEIVSKEDSP